MNIARLGIGTVQFGLDYGISNTEGKVQSPEIVKILSYAFEKKVRLIDTAHLYGTSEAVLGKCIQNHDAFNIVTKTMRFSDSISDADTYNLEFGFRQSLNRLKSDNIYGLLIHNVDDLMKPKFDLIWNKMLEFKKHGYVKKIGVSVYNSEQIDFVIKNYDVDIIQLPINVFDQRLLESGHLTKLKKRRVEIHARSIFLQGLLLMPLNSIPKALNFARPCIEKYHGAVVQRGFSLLDVALKFVFGINELDCILVGICSLKQLQQIGEVVEKDNYDLVDFNNFALHDEKILNPSLWELK